MEINSAKKDYCKPMHTAEHILNQTMIRTFGCQRSMNAHIEKTKSKCDYTLNEAPSDAQMQAVAKAVNEVIAQNLPITTSLMNRAEAAEIVDLSKLPADATEMLRIVRVGNYDVCPCIGAHVENTSEIGAFILLNYSFESQRLRIRFKLG
jgi:Ser-tRNA(Ala) deacylase AlaX